MLDPIGPLPAAVYWRRRIVALSGFVLATTLGVWVVMAFIAGPRVPASPPPPPALPVPQAAPELEPPECADQAIRVSVEAVRPGFRLGERVGLRMIVTNTSDRTCVRDTNRALRELIVSDSEGQRVWSSNDCYAESTNEMPVLRPGEAVRNEIAWLATTSAPGCPLGRHAASPAGEYSAVAKLGPLTSSPAPFHLG